MKRLLLLCCAVAGVLTAAADEGMWMLPDLKTQNAITMREMGLDIAIEDIYSENGVSLKDAVIHFGSGCTGEIISNQGLILTNHHCGYGSIQRLSSVEHDYLKNGFWAMTREQELPVEGLTITFIEKILDVTDYVREQLDKDDDPEGTNYLSTAYLTKVGNRFAKANDLLVDDFHAVVLKAFYGGNKYYLFHETIYRDIRFVGAPPSSIGKFGADTDNWMWPRHCGDFSMFRVYATADGSPTHYSTANQPLVPKRWCKINLKGVSEGDFTFVMGFPGRNYRNMIADEVVERMQTTNLMRKEVRTARLNALLEEMLKSDEVRIKYAAKYASSANYWKNAIGMNEGLERLNTLQTKKEQQERLLAYGRQQGTDQYQKAFDTLQRVMKNRFQAIYHQQAIAEALMTGVEFYSEEAMNSKDYDAEVDRKVSKVMMKVYADLVPEEQRVDVFKVIGKKYKGNIDSYVDDCFSKNKGKEMRTAYRQMVSEAYKATSQAMATDNKELDRAHMTWIGGNMQMHQSEGRAIYPDANSTLRLTYGKIGSYKPRDGVMYKHYTTLRGVMEKEDPDNYEFVVPARLKELYEKKDFGRYAMPNGEMPVCFATATDNTGGNSGSPVFNKKGELVGLNFDRNYEGLTGDIAYQPELQRAVAVDIRYVVFVIDKFAGCQRVVDELDIVKF
ncbi:MAG: S46 family peptidase [Bacteroidales bacterium]|nr:S46 family peptidase [Bacteroidales bacterium]